MKNKTTNLANYLTGIRIIGAGLLYFIRPLTLPFYIIYTLCGITDALDGWIARKTGSESAFGARLDSIADLLLYGAMLVRLLPFLWVRLPLRFWWALGAVLAVRLCSYAVAFIKYRCFASLHTYGNKVTGFLLFFLPYLMRGEELLIPSCIICAVAGAASLEELLIHLCAKEYKPDTKTIFKA